MVLFRGSYGIVNIVSVDLQRGVADPFRRVRPALGQMTYPNLGSTWIDSEVYWWADLCLILRRVQDSRCTRGRMPCLHVNLVQPWNKWVSNEFLLCILVISQVILESVQTLKGIQTSYQQKSKVFSFTYITTIIDI
jgi:hypothetical protein